MPNNNSNTNRRPTDRRLAPSQAARAIRALNPERYTPAIIATGRLGWNASQSASDIRDRDTQHIYASPVYVTLPPSMVEEFAALCLPSDAGPLPLRRLISPFPPFEIYTIPELESVYPTYRLGGPTRPASPSARHLTCILTGELIPNGSTVYSVYNEHCERIGFTHLEASHLPSYLIDVYLPVMSGHEMVYAPEDATATACDTGDRMLREDAHQWDNGEWYSYPEPDDDYDDDDDDDDADSLINSYHGTRRAPWVRNPPRPWQMGFENEVWAGDAAAYARAIYQRFSPDDIVLERDGSLCSTHGVELKTPCVNFEQCVKWVRDIATLHSDEFPIGNQLRCSNLAGEGSYGQHVSICTKGWDQRHIDRVLAWLLIHQDIGYSVCRRSPTHYATTHGLCKAAQPTPDDVARTAKRTRYSVAYHYEESDRLEYRQPKAFAQSIMNGTVPVEYLHSVCRYIESTLELPSWNSYNTPSGFADTGAYVKWLRQEANATMYPNLIRRLEEDGINPTPFAPIPA